MKSKQTIKYISELEPFIREVEAEIIRIGDYSFGLFWRDGYINMIELSTGMSVGVESRPTSKAPRETLIKKATEAISNGYLENCIKIHSIRINNERKRLEREMERLPPYPVNQSID